MIKKSAECNCPADYEGKRCGEVSYSTGKLGAVRDFQLRHDAIVYIGEFSAIAWAEGAGEYLTDCISIFEEYGWNWSYHAFREFTGWSVEHESDRPGSYRPSPDNPRKRALLDGFRRPKGHE